MESRTAKAPGERLRALRENLGLTLSEVERLTRELANQRHKPRLAIPKSRLSETEVMGRMPSVHTLYALSVVYRCDIRKLLAIYGLK
jgi:transcriptional regulator with XRE-family HTH domain